LIERSTESNRLANSPDGHGTRRSCLPSDEVVSYGQSHSMRIPYETLDTTTAGTSHCWASCTPYPPTGSSSRSDTMERRYNPEIIQSRRLADRSVAERRFDPRFFVFMPHHASIRDGWSKAVVVMYSCSARFSLGTMPRKARSVISGRRLTDHSHRPIALLMPLCR